MSQDFRANLYPQALARIKRLERALVRDLRVAQKGLKHSLPDARSRIAALHHLTLRLLPILRTYARAAFAEGAHIAAVKMRADKVTFNTRPQKPAESQLEDIPDIWADWYEQTLETTLSAYTQRIRQQIGELTQQAASEGLTTSEFADKIADLVDGLTTWQAERIARTEIMRLWNMGHYAQMEESEEVVGYAYSVVMDDRTSHFCAPLHGVKVRRDDLEIVPPLHPHCRTILEPVYSFDDVGEDEWTDGGRVRPLKGFGVLPDLGD